jgi:hypothetical protein
VAVNYLLHFANLASSAATLFLLLRVCADV